MTQSFKGIALFTPGGDLIYCLDPDKQERWHLHLCLGLQEILQLPEPPHFLIPAYTATVDHWREPKSQQWRTIAEVYPAVKRYRVLLNAIFDLDHCHWQVAPWHDEYCNPIIIERYRSKFPSLWESHDLILKWQTNARHPSRHLPASLSKVVQPTHELEPEAAIKSSTEVIHPRVSPQNQPLATSLSNFHRSDPATTQPYVLRLFVSEQNLLTTERALSNVHRILEQGLKQPYTLKVIDISKHPELAENNQVSATPTLVRVWPQPIRRIVGQLEDWERILQILSHV